MQGNLSTTGSNELHPATAVTDVQNAHVSIRTYRDEPIADPVLDAILEAGRRSPTSSNLQAYSIIVVREPAAKRQLAELAGGQKHIERCPVFLAFCADVHRLDAACRLHDQSLARNLENFLVSSVDAALVGMTVQTAAESFGLGSVMIGGMRNHPARVAEVLGLPDGVYVVYGMCLGWPVDGERPAQKPRLPAGAVIHQERYQTTGTGEAVRDYDRDLAAHYDRDGRNQHDAAWTGFIAKQFSEPRRGNLRAELEEQGFVFR